MIDKNRGSNTGTENINFWQERYGKRAGEAPMVSRIHGQSSFASQGAAGYTINQDGSTSGNNILVHSIRCLQTQEDSDNAVMELFDNSTNATDMTAASKKLRFLCNAQNFKNSIVQFEFPIPMLLVNGGRIYRADGDTSGPMVSICYTVLNSKGDIDPLKDIFLQSACQSGDAAITSVVTDSDTEVLGVYINNTFRNESDGNAYTQVNIRNGDNSTRATIFSNEMWTDRISTGDKDYELDSSDPVHWFSYPVHCKNGLKIWNTGSEDSDNDDDGNSLTADETYSTVFYRKLNSKGLSYGWT